MCIFGTNIRCVCQACGGVQIRYQLLLILPEIPQFGQSWLHMNIINWSKLFQENLILLLKARPNNSPERPLSALLQQTKNLCILRSHDSKSTVKVLSASRRRSKAAFKSSITNKQLKCITLLLNLIKLLTVPDYTLIMLSFILN